jgi:hypothetical protein
MISLLKDRKAFLHVLFRMDREMDRAARSFILVYELKPGRQGQSLWARISEQIDFDVLNRIGTYVVSNVI